MASRSELQDLQTRNYPSAHTSTTVYYCFTVSNDDGGRCFSLDIPAPFCYIITIQDPVKVSKCKLSGALFEMKYPIETIFPTLGMAYCLEASLLCNFFKINFGADRALTVAG